MHLTCFVQRKLFYDFYKCIAKHHAKENLLVYSFMSPLPFAYNAKKCVVLYRENNLISILNRTCVN